jgi:hypothetical protein
MQALGGGELSASRSSRFTPCEKKLPVAIGKEAGWAPQFLWGSNQENKKILPLTGMETRTSSP